MTPEQQIQNWANQMAARFESQVKTIPDARYRARALRDILNDVRPGLSNKVTAATVALQKQGVQPLERALHQALAKRLEIYLKSILKAGGAYDTESDLGDLAGEALGTFNASAFTGIMDSVTSSLSSIGEVASSITNVALRSRQERAALRAQEREAVRQTGLEELRVIGEIEAAERASELQEREAERRERLVELEEREAERRGRLEEMRLERELREEELREEEAAARERAEARASALAPLPAAAAGGGGLLIAGLLGVLVIGGGTAIFLYTRKDKKGKK